ncbi:hypothetical protein DF185_18620 [Marinifilum breve]|uniref:Uncharacterized protein n=1 Tax=Marinifilum breve TaxID=2184082 RepID=A0A2V3ZTJ6_9BACT|nr:hypothetical protein [Marinifilum breve]PXX97039.1 hypothetical protein DF185_18620 [Marinifilum breve]
MNKLSLTFVLILLTSVSFGQQNKIHIYLKNLVEPYFSSVDIDHNQKKNIVLLFDNGLKNIPPVHVKGVRAYPIDAKYILFVQKNYEDGDSYIYITLNDTQSYYGLNNLINHIYYLLKTKQVEIVPLVGGNLLLKKI